MEKNKVLNCPENRGNCNVEFTCDCVDCTSELIGGIAKGFCPECGAQLIHVDSCIMCPCCGYSECACAECRG